MPSTETLLRRKDRLTEILRERDDYRLDNDLEVEPETLIRARLFKIDQTLEKRGVFGGGSSLWTPDGWLIGAEHIRGNNANYRAGRIVLRCGIVHYTVGVDSTGIGVRGYFKFLLTKDGRIKQFSPWDAVDYHACEANAFTFGVETEKKGDWEPTTNGQLLGWGRILAGYWQKGLPREINGRAWYNGVRSVPPRGPYPAPLVSHEALDIRACDFHTDYLPDEDMRKIVFLAHEVLGEETGDGGQRRRRRVYSLS